MVLQVLIVLQEKLVGDLRQQTIGDLEEEVAEFYHLLVVAVINNNSFLGEEK